jgi:hypothetical protein
METPQKKRKASNRANLSGQYFTRLKALFYYDTHKKHARWFCECACGNFKVVAGRNLISGDAKSCGCIGKEKEHHLTHTRLYSIWKNMKSRCYLKTKREYHRYGGRGIQVCAEWKESFKLFAEWALIAGYKDSLTLDRKDNDGNYYPDNCRWATRKQQSNNMSSNHLVTWNGKTQSVADWGRETGICA